MRPNRGGARLIGEPPHGVDTTNSDLGASSALLHAVPSVIVVASHFVEQLEGI
jgi:hypothetical protein